ncbi:DUF5050 domain-containing protein [Neptuniibacter sp.]|uniref:TolB family protein n=1 Tax=Neptuniibacter sp. TaxID=1962643 RepID=UPI00262A4E1C|nr:DUF5050 domain-containing protein [Neptuniibacter sp.]MCP4598645.1 DUF5050 domain-containing protein [Neptuniibacter sp.]
MDKSSLIKIQLILLTFPVAIACVACRPHVNTNPPDGLTERILYCSESDRGQEIYIVGTDGSGPLGLTNAPDNTHNCENLVWHPDGQQVAFLSDHDGVVRQVYQVSIDGSGLLNLSSKYDVGSDFSWSPDGQLVVFTSSDGIYTMRDDGSERRKVHDYSLTIPRWSPNGQYIAFGAEENGKGVIYVINADGTEVRQVAQSRGSSMYSSLYLDWSPDSKRITFRAMLDDNNYEIAVANVDGSDEIILTNTPTKDDWPSWSPDGRQIVFYSDRDGNSEIYKMNADGSDQVRLTHNSTSDMSPKWSPDGARIAFVSGDFGDKQVFIMNANGSARTQLTRDAGSKCCISWQP